MERIIFHIDVNSAYLSWTAVEQLKNGAEQDLRNHWRESEVPPWYRAGKIHLGEAIWN